MLRCGEVAKIISSVDSSVAEDEMDKLQQSHNH